MTSPTWKQTTSPWKGPPPLGRNPYRPVQTVRRQPVAQPQNLETPATGLLRQRLGTQCLGAVCRHYTEHNFYRAAKYGIGADIIWPHKDQVQLQDTPLLNVARDLLPRAREALQRTAVDEAEIHRLLGVIEGRIQARMTGARWQRQVTESFFRSQATDEAFKSMLSRYMSHQKTNTPLHEWTLSP